MKSLKQTDKQTNKQTPIAELNNPVCRKEERIRELEGISEKITQNVEQGEKEMKKYEGKLKDAKIRMKLSNTHLLGVPNKGSIENGEEAIYEYLLAKNIQ